VTRSIGIIALLLLAAFGCKGEPAAEPRGGDAPSGLRAVATYAGGEVDTSEADRLIRALPPEERQGDTTKLLETYERVAADRAVEEIVLLEIGGPQGARAMLGDEWEALRHQLVLDRWLRARRDGSLEVTEAEVDAFYQEHRTELEPPAQRFVSMIFRRSDDPERSDAVEALEQARLRIERGEAFADVARAVSQSETRTSGGRLGWIATGQLEPRVEAALFSLANGEISGPITVNGGSAIFYVQGVRDGLSVPDPAIRQAIAQTLAAKRRRAWLSELAIGLEPPPNAEVWPLEELRVALDRDPSKVVFDIGGNRLEAAAFVTRLNELRREEAELAPPLRRDDPQLLEDLYREELTIRLLGIEARSAPLSGAAAEDVEAETNRLGSLLATRRELERRMSQLVGESELQQFHRHNRHLYASTLEMRLALLAVPLGPQPLERNRELEALVDRARTGAATLDQIAARLDGQVATTEWLTPEQLQRLPPKVAQHARALAGVGISPVFKIGQGLAAVEVLERREPQPLPYEEVAAKVRADYLERHRQRLYQRISEDLLTRARFEFRADVALELLAKPTPAGAVAPANS
jgi:parvulin-like peptidyl-prolyl isomerase